MAESEQVQDQEVGAESSQRQTRQAADKRHEAQQEEEQRKGILRHIFEFFVRLLGIGKKREEEKARQEGQDRQQGQRGERAGPGGKSGDKEPAAKGPARDGQSRSTEATPEAPDARQGDASGWAAGGAGMAAGAVAGGAAAHRELLDAAQSAGPADPDSLMGMAQKAGGGPAAGNAPASLAGMRSRAEAVFAAHAEDMKSRIVPEASTDDQPVYDHTRPSSLDMDSVDQQLADLLSCKGDVPTQDELVSSYYGACMMGKLHQLQHTNDTGLVDQNSESVMEDYLSEVDAEVEKMLKIDFPEERRGELREQIIERLKPVYADIAPKGHGTLEDRVLAKAAKAEGTGPQRGQQQDFSM